MKISFLIVNWNGGDTFKKLPCPPKVVPSVKLVVVQTKKI